MTDKTIVLVTGGSSGLGLEIVKALLRSTNAYHVIVAGRSLERAQTAVKAVKEEFKDTKSELAPVQLDVEDDASIENAFKTVQATFPRIDALINNAGALFDGDLMMGKLSMREAWNKSWDVNVTGSQIVTHTFAPLLLASSNPRLLFMTSGTASLANAAIGIPALFQPPPAGWPKPPAVSSMAYRSSKTGLNMLMLEWARIFKNDGVKIWALQPGFLATNLGGQGSEVLKQYGAIDAAVGGDIVRDIIEGKRDADVGKVIAATDVQPW